jgi:hypothetical protein
MKEQKIQTLTFLLITILVSIAGWIALFQMMIEKNFIHTSLKWQVLLVGFGLWIVLQGSLIVLYALPGTERKVGRFLDGVQSLQLPPIISGILLSLLSAVYPLLVFSPWGLFFQALWLRIFILWFVAILGSLIIGSHYRISFIIRMAFAFSLSSFFYVLYSFHKSISTSPFTLTWSEASRYYYASLFNASHLYGQRLAWPFLHPSRYLMQSIPFFVGDFPIVIHRLWQVFLWVSMPLLTIWLFIRRIISIHGIKAWMFVIWSFIFLYQGPVYYHLFVCVWIILLGYDKQKSWKTMIFVILGSLWAGISRVNWFPVPAMLAIVLYFLDTPFPGKQKFLAYFTWPGLFGFFGLLSALGSQVAYAFLSGEAKIEAFGSSFSSDLLWYRLLPNSTSEWGIIFPIIFLTLPVLILISNRVYRSNFHFWQLMPIAAIQLILFLGGLVVSTKIGGGGNLHNLDAWLVLLWLIAGKFLLVPAQAGLKSGFSSKIMHGGLVLMLFLLPSIYHLDIDRSYHNLVAGKTNIQKAEEELQSIISIANKVQQSGEEVLFISQRQLLIFEALDVPLVAEYELLTLMEMAISNNQPYLNSFREDLQNHRFGIIVIEKQAPKLTDRNSSHFSEENNAWVMNITFPLLKNYREMQYFPISGVTILVPLD